MIVLKSKLPDQDAYNNVVSENPEQHLEFIVAKNFGKRIYVRNYDLLKGFTQ